MDNLLLVGVAIGGFLLLNNKENYEHRENFTILDPPVVNKTTEVDEEVDLLDMKKRSVDDFKHNHFIPNRKRDTGYVAGSGLSLGSDPAYMSKADRCIHGPLFPPTSGLTYVQGVPSRKPDLDRFKGDMKYKNKETPIEPIRVGPGIGVDIKEVASGGYNSGIINRVEPHNIFNYVTNSLPGQVVAGQRTSSIRPTANVSVAKNSNTTYYTRDKVPLLPNSGPDGSYTQPLVGPLNRVGENVGFGKLNCN